MTTKRRKRRFITGAAWLFRQAWCADYASDCHRVGSIEAWRRNKDKLHQSWEAYMHSILSPMTWLALLLLLERRRDIRWAWLKPGGYFFTKARNRRKHMRETLRPKRRPVNKDDHLIQAEHIYREALDQEGENFENSLTILTLFLAGSITQDSTPSHVPSIERHPYGRRRRRRRLWSPSITNSLRYLCRIGFLQQPRKDDPRL